MATNLLFGTLGKATALEKVGYKTSDAEEIRKKAAGDADKEEGFWNDDTTSVAITAGASAIGGILTSRAQLKAQERQLTQSKARNRVSIEANKAQLQNSTLQNLAANLANTIIGGR